MSTPAILEVIVQKAASDCAIAAVAMLAGKPYRDVSDAALKLSPKSHKSGMWTPEILKLAKRVGCALVKQPLDKLDDDATGLLVVRQTDGTSHAVAVFQGVVVDPASGLLYDRETFFKTKRYRPRAWLAL